jgi:hypothetical protein
VASPIIEAVPCVRGRDVNPSLGLDGNPIDLTPASASSGTRPGGCNNRWPGCSTRALYGVVLQIHRQASEM